MQLLLLLVLASASTFVPGAPETLAVTYVEKLHHSRMLVALCCATGQEFAFLMLYLFGEWVMKRWANLARQVAEVRRRFANHLEQRFLLITVPAGVLGFPPAIAMSVLGGSLEVPITHLMGVLFVTRIVRFSIIIFVGDIFGMKLVHWVQGLF